MSLPNPLARFAITAAQIERVVTRFYARVRTHPVLGPIFAAHVTNWPEHEAKIAGFWRNAILRERSYDGNPMRVHVTRPEIKPEHFAVWLGLFHEVLRAELPEDIAAQWAALADRIGEGCRTGIVSMRQRPDEVPSLF